MNDFIHKCMLIVENLENVEKILKAHESHQ